MVPPLPLIAPDWALFLDVDGTLLDYVPQPDSARVSEPLRRTLAALQALLDGALALVSGRSIADLDRLFAPLSLSLAGQHGAEARHNGKIHTFAPASPALDAILARARSFAAHLPGIMIENKGLSAAIHYRGAEEARGDLGELLARSIVETGAEFQLYPGHLAYDIQPRGANKGFAVDWFMAAPPFAGRVPVFIGDERTDEDGFVAAIAHGGRAVKIGRQGASLAPWRMAEPDALRLWLDQAVAALEHSP